MYEYDYSSYGYADFSTASNEAYQLSWDAYYAGDMDASNAWNDISWSNWSVSTDLYVNGADPYGTESPSTSNGYYTETGAFNPSGTDYSYSSDYSSYSTDYSTSTDYSSSYATTDSSSYYSSDYSSSYTSE
jgi:hypothetical protein